MPPLPLYAFFSALRRYNFALGVSDYALLLEALNGGYGLQSEQDLLRLCRTLWFKPGQSWDVFQDQFWRAIRDAKGALQIEASNTDATALETNSDTKIEQQATPDEDLLQDDRSELEPPKPQPQTIENTVETEGRFVHLSIASSAELAGETLQSTEQLHQRLEAEDFLFQGRFQAISSRQLTQTWRYLPTRPQYRQSSEVDIHGTVEQIARTGMIQDVVFQQQAEEMARLLILIDIEGSMIAFHDLAEQIIASAPSSENEIPAHLYFHDVPGPQLFRDVDQTRSYQIQELKSFFIHRKASILIISDAGAARGRYDRQRVLDT
ncbi:MAG: hypothetical protein AAFP02_02670, partial [Bacteroidota bacterium]